MAYINKKWILISLMAILLIGGVGAFYFIRTTYFNPNWEIVDKLDGNIFPSVILSTATTGKILANDNDSNSLGNLKTPFGIVLKSYKKNSTLRITIEESPFFKKTETTLTLPKSDYEYTVYPDIVWKYDRLRFTNQAEPVDVSFKVKIDKNPPSYKHKTFSVRSFNEALMGYKDSFGKYHSTAIFFAAYVNEEHPVIDKILKEALATGKVKRFTGYQYNSPRKVKRQVFAIWNALQKRGFKYSSLTNTSIGSQKVYTQRIRTIDDALEAEQLNCVDASVLFASVLKAIGIDPILIRIPGHMFLGFYLDKNHKKIAFLETTLISDVDLDEYVDEKQQKDLEKMSQTQASLATFNLALENGMKKYEENKEKFGKDNPNYTFLEISKELREQVQPIGK